MTMAASGFELHRLRQRGSAALTRLADWALFFGIVLFGGLGTSWYMIESGSPLTTEASGPWVSWTATGRADADPYTRANDARRARLTLAGDIAQTYFARVDASRTKLHSSCDYLLQGRDFGGRWWSIAAFDERGRLIANSAQRYAYTSDTIATGSNGTFTVTLSRDARPGNWLPTGGAGRLVLVMTIVEPQDAPRDGKPGDNGTPLPTITKVACR